MKVEKVFNRFFHFYVINVTMITYMGFFWHTLLCFHLKCTMDFITFCWHDCFMSFPCTLNWPKCLLFVCKVWRKWIDFISFLGPNFVESIWVPPLFSYWLIMSRISLVFIFPLLCWQLPRPPLWLCESFFLIEYIYGTFSLYND